MNPFPNESDLAEFFGALPRLADEGIPWYYNRVVFEHRRGGDCVQITIEPAARMLEIVWTQGSVERLRLDLNRVSGLSLDRDEGQAVVVAHLADPLAKDLRVRLLPSVHVEWGDRVG